MLALHVRHRLTWQGPARCSRDKNERGCECVSAVCLPQRPRWVEARLAFRTPPQPKGSPGATATVTAAARGPPLALLGPARRALLDAVARRCGVPPGCVLLERVGVEGVGAEGAAADGRVAPGLSGGRLELDEAGLPVGSQGEGTQLLYTWLTVKLPRGTTGAPGVGEAKRAGEGCGGGCGEGSAALAGGEQQCAAQRIAESLTVGAAA